MIRFNYIYNEQNEVVGVTTYPLDENLLIVELNKEDFDALNKEIRENYLERQKTKNSREVPNEPLKRN